jgi:tryptophan halogenase
MKISVVGGGNGGCFTALYLAWHRKDIEVELIYNPEVLPERVGQATVLSPPTLLWAATGFDWYHNHIHATMKSGILYEGWGQVNEEVFHPFPPQSMAMHYCPWEMQASILQSGHFKVTHGDVDPKDVDADYVFDCRGKPDDFSEYDELINPINACVLGKPKWNTSRNSWSRHVATPDGWTFVIPTRYKSPSHDFCVGYCYNSDITQQEVAEYNFLERFDVDVTKHVKFKNYVAKNPIVDDRIILNGNRLFFLEPLESSSTQTYIMWADYIMKHVLTKEVSFSQASKECRRYVEETQNFVLWHYQYGSKYNTPFWDYAKTLTFKDQEFDRLLYESRSYDKYGIIPKSFGGRSMEVEDCFYAQWTPYSFKVWDQGMTKELTDKSSLV